MPSDDFLFRVFTEKGRFHASINADDLEVARLRVNQKFIQLGLAPSRIVHAKTKSPKSNDESVILNDDGTITGAKNIWYATDHGVEFEATLILNSSQNDS